MRLLLATFVVALVASPVTSGSPASAAPLKNYLVAFPGPEVPEALLEARGIHPTSRYASTGGFAAELTPAQASRLRRSGAVLNEVQEVRGFAQTVPPAVGSVEADEAPVLAGNGTGSWTGPTVAMLDSGLTPHVDINLGSAVDCTGLGSGADGNGHGTGVAGAIGAFDNGSGIVGVAPGAPIHSVRVLDSKLVGSTQTMLCGIDWVATHAKQYDITVVNLSLGYYGADDGNCGFTNGDLMHQAICSLTQSGIAVVASAGNSTQDLAGYVPAAYDEVLAVTNMGDYDGNPGGLAANPCGENVPDDRYTTNSNFAVSVADQNHTLAAPGTCPFTTKKGNRYGYIASGTSMAAAIASGVVLNCYANGACSGKSSAEAVQVVRDQAAAAAQRGHVFTGDPLHPVAGRYYGFNASTIPTSSTPSPTPTPTPTPTPDTEAPVATIVSPASGTTVSGSVTVVVEASDNVGVTEVTLWSGSTRLGVLTKKADGKWEAAFSSSRYPNGTYPLVARPKDAAGNTGASAASSMKVAN